VEKEDWCFDSSKRNQVKSFLLTIIGKTMETGEVDFMTHKTASPRAWMNVNK